VDVDGLVALLTEDALMTMPPEGMRVASAQAIGEFFGSVPQGGRLDEIRLVRTSANRQPALAAYARYADGKHRPYGVMVLQFERGGWSGSVARLQRLAAALGIGIWDLVATDGLPRARVLRREARQLLVWGHLGRKALLTGKPLQSREVIAAEFDAGGSTGDE